MDLGGLNPQDLQQYLPAEDSKVLMELFEKTGTIYFDVERKVVIFSNISLG